MACSPLVPQPPQGVEAGHSPGNPWSTTSNPSASTMVPTCANGTPVKKPNQGTPAGRRCLQRSRRESCARRSPSLSGGVEHSRFLSSHSVDAECWRTHRSLAAQRLRCAQRSAALRLWATSQPPIWLLAAGARAPRADSGSQRAGWSGVGPCRSGLPIGQAVRTVAMETRRTKIIAFMRNLHLEQDQVKQVCGQTCSTIFVYRPFLPASRETPPPEPSR